MALMATDRFAPQRRGFRFLPYAIGLTPAGRASDEGPLALQAGPDGLEVLILQFPVAEAYPPQ